ncbi:hypothetical protein HO133_000953 [Letharia lupina]|uniref:Uncharacterized protein n=1 Tax=Letharia lupina TaxID=560253 RepID=A0A8H6CG48_9LECA|nr:uncharacterized protein HO133_000953 [Letharia lupina]KAF6222902.1 hypothetical protein HO133_000953 [Letharia lupina]
MNFSYTESEFPEHANNMHPFAQDTLRNEIWAYCLQFEDDVEIAVTAKRMMSCKGGLQNPGTEAPTALAPQLLRTNKQIRKEGCAIMCKRNNFSIVLNQASYLGYSSRIPLSISVAGGDLASIPSKWTSKIRHYVHHMRQLTLYVTLNPEHETFHTPSRMLLEDKKLEVAAIVGTALGELCEILSFSNNLKSLKVNFLALGTEQLTTGHEHKVLECLGQLKGLKHIEICGVPKDAKDYLENIMRLSKRSEKERKEFPSSRAGYSWGSPY